MTDSLDTEDNHIARLESEIRYLKGLLDENGIAYDYDAFAEAERQVCPVEIEFPALTVEHRCHERYAVIDHTLVWYGSTNLLSNDHEGNSLMRLVSSPQIAAELLERVEKE